MEPKWHAHQKSGISVYGIKLSQGTRLEATDLYDSSDGKWRACPCPGVTLETEGPHVVWIRPQIVPKN